MVAFGELSRMHGFKISTTFLCSVEDCSLAVAEIVGHSSIRSAARMNGAVVMFVDSVAKANKVVEKGIVVKDSFVSVSPLTTPTTRITISNIPPFIGDEVLLRELSRHGKIVSAIRKLPSGCKSPLLRHVVSHRRQVHMILHKKDSELNLVFKLRVDDFDYAVFVNSGNLKCFACGKEGHLVRACPDKTPGRRAEPTEPAEASAAQSTADSSKDVDTVEQQAASVENNLPNNINIESIKEYIATRIQYGENPNNESQSVVENGEQVVKNLEKASVCVENVDNDKQSECVDQEEGNSSTTEQAECVEAGPISAAAEHDSEEGVMEEEENLCKAPLLKRKQAGEACGSKSKARKPAASREQEEEQIDTDSECSDEETGSSGGEEEMEDCGTDSQPLTDSQMPSASQLGEMYSVKSIRFFLQETKNMKNPKYKDYFADVKMLLVSVNAQMKMRGEGGFTDTEYYRLKTMGKKIRKQLNDDVSECT